MVISTARLAYSDCFDLMDRAIEDSIGCRAQFDDEGQAMHFRMRLNKARVIDRECNMAAYTPDSPMYGQSIYDKLVARLRIDTEGKWWVYVEHRALMGIVESLSEGLSEGG
jgi:hypothetical protein